MLKNYSVKKCTQNKVSPYTITSFDFIVLDGDDDAEIEKKQTGINNFQMWCWGEGPY